MRRSLCVTRADQGGATKEQLLEVAQTAAKAATQIIMSAVDKPRTISFKGTTDLVTETDKNCEEAIIKVIREAFPHHALLGEEGGASGDVNSDFLWCIDPLDGTTNFAHGYPSFATSIGVLRKSQPAAGVVVEFSGGPGSWVARTYTATKGGGAFFNGQRLSASKTAAINQSLLVTGFGYEHDEPWLANMDLFKQFTDESRGVRRLGAAAVDLCHVALGIVDGYWEYRLKPWDVCAGVLIAQEAGAKVTTMEGEPFSVFDRSLLAAAPGMHEAMIAKTKPATAKLRQGGIDFSHWFIPDGYKVQKEGTAL
jgi:myo-inositol-1(or 4)-monophosphatase